MENIPPSPANNPPIAPAAATAIVGSAPSNPNTGPIEPTRPTNAPPKPLIAGIRELTADVTAVRGSIFITSAHDLDTNPTSVIALFTTDREPVNPMAEADVWRRDRVRLPVSPFIRRIAEVPILADLPLCAMTELLCAHAALLEPAARVDSWVA